MNILSNACVPDYLLSADPSVIVDAQYCDFDEQAQRLTGFDQTYLQLSSGPFQGRFLTCVLGPHIALHIEHCNQALEQSVAGHETAFTLGVLINDSAPFRLHGMDLSGSEVLIAAPGANLHLRSPENGAILAFVIDQNRLRDHPGLTDPARDWLFSPDFGARIIHAPQFAARLREDATQAVQSACLEQQSSGSISHLGEALLAAVASKLSLEHACAGPLRALVSATAYEKFRECRDTIRKHWDDIYSMDDLLRKTGGARRSLQGSFASEIEVGPLTYHRLLRLHLVRDALSDPRYFDDSIGDVAARFEFWSWSHFTKQYHSHFGELPSRTRQIAGFAG